MPDRRTILSTVLMTVIIVATVASFLVWRQQQRADYTLRGVPAIPDLSRWPAAFSREVQEATALAQEANDPTGPLAKLANLYLANAYAAQALPPLGMLRQLDPTNARWAYLLADALLRIGENEAAEKALEETVKLDPHYLPAWFRLGSFRAERNEFAAARDCFARAAAAAPNDVRAVCHFITFEAQSGRGGDLRPRLVELTQAHPDIKDLHSLLAELNTAAGDQAGAAREHRLAATTRWQLSSEDEWIDELSQFSFSPDHLKVLASKAALERRFDTANFLLKRAIELAPADPKLRVEAGPVYELMGQPGEAMRILERGMIECPDDPSLPVQLSRMLCSQGRADQAVAMLRKALQRWPAQAAVHAGLGIALSNSGKNEAAVAELREAIRLDFAHVEAHYNLGVCLLATGQREAARAAVERALTMRPDYVNALLLFGGLTLDDGDVAAAEPAIKRVFALRPDDPRAQLLFATLQLRKGIEADRAGNFIEADNLFRTGLEALPGHAPLLRARGMLAIRQERFDQAIDAFRACVEANSKNPGDYLMLGQVLQKAGRSAEAREILQRGLRLAEESGIPGGVEKFRQALGR